jgi:hypothetical protein
VILTVGLTWGITGTPLSVIAASPVILGGGLPFVFGWGRIEYTVDPDRSAVALYSHQADRTFDRSLEWALGVRRVDLGILSLFLFSNRGKRWYEGPHLLPVPTGIAADVEQILRQVSMVKRHLDA